MNEHLTYSEQVDQLFHLMMNKEFVQNERLVQKMALRRKDHNNVLDNLLNHQYLYRERQELNMILLLLHYQQNFPQRNDLDLLDF